MTPNSVERLKSLLYIVFVAAFFSKGGFFVAGILLLLGIIWIILAAMEE